MLTRIYHVQALQSVSQFPTDRKIWQALSLRALLSSCGWEDLHVKLQVMIYGDVLVPNKFYKYHVQLYVSHQSKFILHPIIVEHRWSLLRQQPFTSPGNHTLILCWGIIPVHIQAIWFWGQGPKDDMCLTLNNVTMIDSGMDMTVRISPRNFARTSGRVKLSLYWDYPTGKV